MERSAGGLNNNNNRTYEDYDPAVERRHAADADTVTISLPGFKREELQVKLDTHGHLWVHGQRPLEAGSNKWIRFKKEVKLPDNCDTNGIRCNFENKTAIITLPKKTRPSSPPPDGSSAPDPVAPMTQEAEKKSSPPSSASDPAAPTTQEAENKSAPSPPEDSASKPALTKREEKKSPLSPPEASASDPAPTPQQEPEKKRPASPPEASDSEPAPTVQEEETMLEIEMMADGRRPINWLLVTMSAVLLVGITAYVVWHKLKTGCNAGADGPGELAGAAGSYISEL